jgi:hypothetical protein
MALKLTDTPAYTKLGPPGHGVHVIVAAFMASRTWWEIATKPGESTSWLAWFSAVGITGWGMAELRSYWLSRKQS